MGLPLALTKQGAPIASAKTKPYHLAAGIGANIQGARL